MKTKAFKSEMPGAHVANGHDVRQAAAEPQEHRTHCTDTLGFLDNRPAAVAQRRLHQSIRQSPHQQTQAAHFARLFGLPVQRLGHAEDRMQPQSKPLLNDTAKARARTLKTANGTGMPDRLKAGVESLSGMDLSDVRVHRNSDKPAQLKALAYAQGSDIHLGPGQEQHLPHEAWHVVQQRQGRVRPTLQLEGTQLNDENALEAEAERMGMQATKQLQAATAIPDMPPASGTPTPVLQRLLGPKLADNPPSPAESIKRVTGVPASQQLLPGGKVQPANEVERPHKIQATIDSKTLRNEPRENSGVLSKVTAMARAEQRILQGTDMQKFYDAGHLIGDQLVAGDGTDSFQYWNLAPQISSFNTPAYAGVEDQIKSLAGSATVHMEVSLTYPSDYTVKVGALKARGIVTRSNSPDDTDVPIYRRIPTGWKLNAVVANAPPQQQQLSAPIRHGSDKAPDLGNPFAMEHRAIALQQFNQQPLTIGHAVAGSQWAPSEDIRQEDILSILAKTFEDLGSPGEIAARILGPDRTINRTSAVRLIKQAAGDVALAQLDLAGRLSELMDPTVMQEYLTVSDPSIRHLLNQARGESTDLGMAVHYLVTAKSWVDALQEKATELRDDQREQYVFPLSVQEALRQQDPSFQHAQAFDFSFTQATPAYAEAQPQQAEMAEQQRSQLVDLSGKYQAIIPNPQGGELLMYHFGPPNLLYDQAVLLDGNQIVRVRDITKEATLEGAETGRWLVKYSNS